jgi:uncharacterized protein
MTPWQLVYLHGFASSAQSSKASFLAACAESAGIPFHCPDLNEPDFRTLTVTRMLDQVDALIDGLGPSRVALIGSSLGGFVAVHAASRRRASRDGHGSIERLILLAPALDLVPSLEQHFGSEKLAEWERTDRLDVFHYGEGRMRELHWGFMADARRYGDADSDVPVLVYQGLRDDTVDPGMVRRFADGRTNVTLHLLDDDHQLLASRERIWKGIATFLESSA